MKKRILAGVMASAAVLTAASFTGCAPAYSDEETLTILAWSGNSDIQAMINYFCEQTGTDPAMIKWAQVGADGTGARDGYGDYLDGNQDADILFCDAEWAPMFANSDYTVDLSEIGISKSQYTDAYDYTLALGTNDDGVFKGATWQVTPGGFLYNAKTAEEKLGVKTPAEMQALVSDWTKFEETAAKLAEAGVAICSTEGGLWQIKQCEKAAKSPWVVDGKLVVDDFARDFIQMAKDYKDKGYITGETQWDPGWYASIQNGDALGEFVPTWGLVNNGGGSIAENMAKEEKGILGFCEGPAEWFWGGTYMEVTSKCNTKELAKQWIEFFTLNADNMKGYGAKSGDFMNNTKVMAELGTDSSLTNDLFKDGTHQFEVLYNRYKSADSIKFTATKYDAIIKQKFNDAVQGYAIKGTTSTVDETVEAFKNGVAGEYDDLVDAEDAG